MRRDTSLCRLASCLSLCNAQVRRKALWHGGRPLATVFHHDDHMCGVTVYCRNLNAPARVTLPWSWCGSYAYTSHTPNVWTPSACPVWQRGVIRG
ncbi:hypothetical protein C8T65DRAFT_115391 [Cerioporus squamosus]|nr:hypothetical protein C8T65DRAFT_115391 [Cerioporus squamosus]